MRDLIEVMMPVERIAGRQRLRIRDRLAFSIAFSVTLFSGFAVAADFVKTQKDKSRWILRDPAGNPMISKGVTNVTFEGPRIRNTQIAPYATANRAKYGSVEEWRASAAKRLIDWGLNTLGSWCDNDVAKADVDGRRLFYTKILDVGARFASEKSTGRSAWLAGYFPDVFSTEFEAHCRRVAELECGPLKNDPNLIGYFLDNELRWGPDWRSRDELLHYFLNLREDSPGRKGALAFLQGRYRSAPDLGVAWNQPLGEWKDLSRAFLKSIYFNRIYAGKQSDPKAAAASLVWLRDCDDFRQLLAKRYFEATHKAIRAVDSNHLILGCRFAYMPGRGIVEEAVKYTDVISLSIYGGNPAGELRNYAGFEKPILISEFSFRAKDSGLPNTKGAGVLLATQEDRANAYEKFVRTALSDPRVIGYHWFQWVDQPKEGRFDGEDSNYGLVTIADEPYVALIERMKSVNRAAQDIVVRNSGTGLSEN